MPQRNIDCEGGTLTAVDLAQDGVARERSVRGRRVVCLGQVAQRSLGREEADQAVDHRTSEWARDNEDITREIGSDSLDSDAGIVLEAGLHTLTRDSKGQRIVAGKLANRGPDGRVGLRVIHFKRFTRRG